MSNKLQDLNIASQEVLLTPKKLKALLPLSNTSSDFIMESRKTIESILGFVDKRLLMVVGPCSIHDLSAAREYAERLKLLSEELEDVFFIIMRVYFEKPRSTIGWKGFVNDPRLDDSFRIEEGLFRAREFLIELSKLSIPAGTEALDPIIPQYLDDLISWTAIGARTTESQTHRELASGLSTPVGFKNGTDGNIDVAINALLSCQNPHHFLGINQSGQISILRTRGNHFAHLVLRGGVSPNYNAANISRCEKRLESAGINPSIVIDCSHGNSQKDPLKQIVVLEDCIEQIAKGNKSIIGFMLESNLHFGNQSMVQHNSTLKYGVSITDACIDWNMTEKCLRASYDRLAPLLEAKQQ